MRTKRLRKKVYKAVVEAKWLLDGWNLDTNLFTELVNAFVPSQKGYKLKRVALRKVLYAGGLFYDCGNWQFFLPKTCDAMKAPASRNLHIVGDVLNKHATSWDDKSEVEFDLDLWAFLKDAQVRPYIYSGSTEQVDKVVRDLLDCIELFT